jgi:hypothetical protein
LELCFGEGWLRFGALFRLLETGFRRLQIGFRLLERKLALFRWRRRLSNACSMRAFAASKSAFA